MCVCVYQLCLSLPLPLGVAVAGSLSLSLSPILYASPGPSLEPKRDQSGMQASQFSSGEHSKAGAGGVGLPDFKKSPGSLDTPGFGVWGL